MEINKNITSINRWKGREGNRVEWIVLHYTANTYQPDLAKNECAAFADHYVGASAHFFVDEREVWQSVELGDTAWHCGDNPPPKNGCTNRNSIGIEMCVVYKKGVYSIPDKTVDNAAALVLELLEAFPEAKICRHYDVTGKRCPMPWVDDPGLWEDFKERVERKPMTQTERKEFDALKAQVASLSAKVTAGEEFDRLIRRDVAKIDGRTAAKFDRVGDMPDWMAPTAEKLVKKGYLKGEKSGKLALTEDQARLLVIVDRAGGFGE
ncbi:MAG: N-acetylmuramoyl-L-alanine amidase [Clostridia bacterium]|nr:N-acetylmuramoyl-L-alanine amidase [Clostridia bacterium]MBR3638978.1 N-acetylmuramoyl-L-alanine amidase [Clostridia bacterium]